MENADENRRSTSSPIIISNKTLPGDLDLMGALYDDWSSFISGLESFGDTCHVPIPDPAVAGSFGAGFLPDDHEVDATKSPNDDAGAIPASGSAHNVLAPYHHLPAYQVAANVTREEDVSGSLQKACNSHCDILKPGHATEQGHTHICKRPRETSCNKGSDGADRKSPSKKSKALIKEERLQKRLEKNRKTAAQSRERKKQEMKEKSEEVQRLKDENARLKNELEVQKRHAQLLREELASFTRSAKEGTVDAAAEPAALLSTTTLPSVHDTVMTMQRRSVPNSSSSQLVDIWSALAFSTSQIDILAQSSLRLCLSLQPPAQRLQHQSSSRLFSPASQTPLLSS